MKDFGDFGFGMISQMVNWGLNQASMGIQQDYNRANMNYQNYLNRELMGLQNKYNTDAATMAYERQKALYNQYMTPEAQLMMLQKAGLSPALMYAKGGSSGASMPNVQQAHPTGLPSTGLPSVTALGMSNTLAQEMKALQESEKIETEMDRMTAETDKIRAEIEKTKGETALQAWSERQVFTISDSQLEAIEESRKWGWSDSTSKSESKGDSNSKNNGWSIGADVDVLNLIPGGKFIDKVTKGAKTTTRTVTEDKGGAGLGLKGGKTEGTSTSSSTGSSSSESHSKEGGYSQGETHSESHSRQVLTWPKIVDGKPAGLYMVVLTGDYSNVGIDLRSQPFESKDN